MLVALIMQVSFNLWFINKYFSPFHCILKTHNYCYFNSNLVLKLQELLLQLGQLGLQCQTLLGHPLYLGLLQL